MLNLKTTSTSHSLINGFDVPSSPCDLPRSKEHVTSSDLSQKTFGTHSILDSKLVQNKPIKNQNFNNPLHEWNLTERKCNNMIYYREYKNWKYSAKDR